MGVLIVLEQEPLLLVYESQNAFEFTGVAYNDVPIVLKDDEVSDQMLSHSV